MMSPPSPPADRAALLAEILSAARRHAPDWTDGNDADPGVLLLQLFAWLADALSSYQDHAAGEAALETGRRLAGLLHHLRCDPGTVVTVDGVLWRPADAVDAGSAGAQTYVLDTAADGTASIRFGDGRSGAKPPDASEVRATYRSGGGAVTLTLHWPPAADFRELAARIGEDGLSLRLAGRAAAAR